MTSGRPPSRADHIGSLLRPKKLREAFRGHAAKALPDAQFRAAQDDAIRDVVKLQEDCGLQVVTDGEFLRISYWEKFVRLTRGLVVWGLRHERLTRSRSGPAFLLDAHIEIDRVEIALMVVLWPLLVLVMVGSIIITAIKLYVTRAVKGEK